MLITNRRAEVGKEAEVFAQAQNRLLGAELALQVVVFPVAHRAEQDGVRFFCEFERRGRQRMAMRLISRAADQRGLHFKL